MILAQFKFYRGRDLSFLFKFFNAFKMDKMKTKKCRPYLSKFPPDELPEVFDSVKDFKSDLDPQLHNMAKAFANHKTNKLQHKLCSDLCSQNQKCSKKCIQEQEARRNELILVDEVDSRLYPVIKSIERGENPDTIVVFEDREFACIGIVLGIYSKFFTILRSQAVIDLRKAPMSAETFELVYKWMIEADLQFQPKDVVQVIRAAYFLDIPELLQQCFAMLDSDVFKEFWAFHIMYTSRFYNELFHINQAMASRISKSTLIIICSLEFLQLSEIQICAMLRSSSLAVNSESEILFGVLHWLNEGWPSRASSVVNVLKHIRFAYLSPRILCKLNGMDNTSIGPFKQVLDEFDKTTEKQKLVGDGIFYSTLVITMGGDISNLEDLPTARAEMMVPRRWIQDVRCPYHRPVTKLVPNMRSIEYEDFALYSETLQETALDYEQYFAYADDVGELGSSDFVSVSDQSNGEFDDSDSTIAWDTESVMSWVHSEGSTICQEDDVSVSSFPAEAEDIASPQLQASAEQAANQWQENLKDFVPSGIWEEWQPLLLDKPNDQED